MTKHNQWHISGWPALLLAPVAIPVILVILACQKLFGLKSTVDLTPANVASYLRDYIQSSGGDWDWDDFTSISITDPFLESVRAEAAQFSYPLDQRERQRLQELLVEVQAQAK